MRITCPHCTESYAVNDDKLRGRIVKIRCRRCASAIVLDGLGETIEIAQGAAAAGIGPAPAPTRFTTPAAPPGNRGPTESGPHPTATLTAPTSAVAASAPGFTAAPRTPPPAPQRGQRRNQATLPAAVSGLGHPLPSAPSEESLPTAFEPRRPALSPPASPLRAPIETLDDLEVDLEEIPPTARSSRYPEAPLSTRPAPEVALTPAGPAYAAPARLPHFPLQVSPFSPTPQSGTAFPWLNPQRLRPPPGWPGAPAEADDGQAELEAESKPGAGEVEGTPVAQSNVAQSNVAQSNVAQASITQTSVAPSSAQASPARSNQWPPSASPTPSSLGLAAPQPGPKEDDDTVSMSHQELLAAADRSSEGRPAFTRTPTLTPRRITLTPREQPEPETDTWWTAPILWVSLVVGALVGALGYLTFSVPGQRVLAERAPTLALLIQRTPFARREGEPLEQQLDRARQLAAACPDRATGALEIDVGFERGIPTRVEIAGANGPLPASECVKRAFFALRGGIAETRSVRTQVPAVAAQRE